MQIVKQKTPLSAHKCSIYMQMKEEFRQLSAYKLPKKCANEEAICAKNAPSSAVCLGRFVLNFYIAGISQGSNALNKTTFYHRA